LIEYRLILTAKEKEVLKTNFLDLFRSVYEKELEEKLWEHQILNSPYSDSPLFLAFDGDKIIGTALMILQKCIIEGKEYTYFLFTTSAILKEYRSKGIYAALLKKQKEYANSCEVAFIFAFPNKLAYPVLKLFGGFKDIRKIDLVKTSLENIDFDSFNNSLVVDNEIFKWRFEHKNYLFSTIKDKVIIYKEFNNTYDILVAYNKSDFDFNFKETKIDSSSKINILAQNIKDIEEVEIIDTLNSTYYPLNKSLDYKKININLLMSDVF